MPRLTDRMIASLTVPPGRKDMMLFDTVTRGLGVRVTQAGNKILLVQYRDPKTGWKTREALAPWGALTVSQARDAARARLGAIAKGIDVRGERMKARAEAEREKAEMALTLDRLIEDWSELHLAHRRARYRIEAVRALKLAFSDSLKRPAARLTRADVVAQLDGLVKRGRAAMASRTMAYGRACYGWAQKRDKVPNNPFDGLPIAATTAARDRVLDDGEIGEIWAATGTMGYPWQQFFRLALLTLQRRETVAGMRWSEINGDLAAWRAPALRMKSGMAHDVALPEAARAVLRTIDRVDGQDLVFSTTGKLPISGFSKAKAALDAAIVTARKESARKAGTKPARLRPWRLHDVRRSGVTALARLGFDSIVADLLLAHRPAALSAVARVYQKHDFSDERARALEAWAQHVSRAKIGNVVPLRRAGG